MEKLKAIGVITRDALLIVIGVTALVVSPRVTELWLLQYISYGLAGMCLVAALVPTFMARTQAVWSTIKKTEKKK